MKKFIFLLLLICCAAPLTAQELAVTAQQIPQQASFSQPYDVHIELAHTPGYMVEINRATLPKDFELTQANVQALSPGTTAVDMRFLPFTLGRSTFTAVMFELKERPGELTTAQALSEPQPIEVKPVQFFNEQTLRDIRPPYIPVNWLIWLCCAIVLALLIYVLRRFWRDTQEKKLTVQEVQDNRPADIIALSKIQLLLHSGLWEKAQYKLFYIELSDILREYFWRRFGLDVSSDTSAELLRRARKEPQLQSLLIPLREFLNSADLVKFAKVVPQAQTTQQDVRTVQTIVRQTTPPPQEGN